MNGSTIHERLDHHTMHRTARQLLCATLFEESLPVRSAAAQEKPSMPTIGLVDDDCNILTSVSIALETEGYQVMPYADGFQALQGFQSCPPDLAILDIKMPHMDGLELLRRLRENYHKPVIFLTCSESAFDELCGFRCGADDFIRKPFSQRVLSERIKMLLRRTASRPRANRIQCGDLDMDLERHTCTWKGIPLTLTVTEFLILQALASRPGVVKSREALTNEVCNEDHFLERAIDSHVKRLRQKFRAVNDRCDPIETVYGVGYCLRERGTIPVRSEPVIYLGRSIRATGG